MRCDFPLLLVTNLETLQYFKNLKFEGKFDDVFIAAKAKCLLSGEHSRFFEIGTCNNIPVVVYDTWHEDDHFVHLMKNAFVGRQVTGESIDFNWDTYLTLH